MRTKLVVHPDQCSDLTELPADISKLVNLQVLDLSHHPISFYEGLDSQLVSLAAIWDQTQLQELNLPISRIVTKLSDGIGQLRWLHTLKLDKCIRLSSLPPEIGQLSALVVLSLAGNWWEVLPAAIWQLPNLRHLDLSGCCLVQRLPALLQPAGWVQPVGAATAAAGASGGVVPGRKLQKLVLEGCCSLAELPDGLSQLTELQVLNLAECSVEVIPAEVWQLPELEELNLRDCKRLTALQALPPNGGGSKVLKLVLENCNSLCSLPAQLEHLTALKVLDLRQCIRLQDLPASVLQLSHLEELDLSYCGELQVVPQQLGQFAGLRVLRLAGWEWLEEVPAAVWQLRKLEELDLSNCQSLTALWLTPSEIGIGSSSSSSSCSRFGSSLARLALSSCTSLVTLPAGIGCLSSLQLLDLRNCTRLQELPAGISELSRLQELKLSFCSSLQSLPSFSSLIHIVDLRIECCDVLKQIPNLGSLCELTSLVIMHCNSLEGMPDGLQQLPHLQRLEVVSCGKLAAWPELGWDVTGPSRTVIPDQHSFTPEAISYVLSGREWPPAVMALQQLRVANVPCLARLPMSLGLASTLMQLELHKCDALEELPRSLNELVMLTKLEVIDCSKLKALPTTTWDIRQLKVLRVKNCDTLTALPDTAARITRPCLERLLLIRCNLTHLPEFVGRLHMLEVLSLCHCGKLESLPWQMKDASRLHTLSLASCTKLSKLPERLPASLALLDLSYCRELASLGESLLSIAHQIGGARVVLAGWDCLIAEHLPADSVRDVQYMQSLYWPVAEASEIGEDWITCPVLNLTDHESASVVKAAIRRATVIEKLLADEGFVRDLLTKLSWLATLLASAAFAAGRAPPGGWISGGLPSCSSNTMGEGTCPAGAEGWLRMFFLFDLLTFGTSAALVMFLVACAIPRRDIRDKAAVAGQMYISLLLSVVLLSAALGFGMCALWAGVLAVYPENTECRMSWCRLRCHWL